MSNSVTCHFSFYLANTPIIPRSEWNARAPLNTPTTESFSAINVLIDHSLTEGCLDEVSFYCVKLISLSHFMNQL